MDIKTPGLHHLALRVSNLDASRHFYGTTLGFPVILEGPGLFLFLAGRTAIGVRAADDRMPAGDAFNPYRVGLDHLAIACGCAQELRRVTAALARAGVPNTGVKTDPTLNREYVAFKDPDGIAWEYYMAPDATRETVAAYVDACIQGRLDAVPVSPAVRATLAEVLPTMRGLHVQKVLVDGEHAVVQYTVDTERGRVPAVDVVRVVNGEVVAAQPLVGRHP